MEIIDILNSNGFKTVVGKNPVLKAIQDAAEGEPTRLCSGFRVFPNGDKCIGCADCTEETKPAAY